MYVFSIDLSFTSNIVSIKKILWEAVDEGKKLC